ncbi:hypothetical protein CRYUN_Cryun09bG0182500 [Craigia yunnanensis]
MRVMVTKKHEPWWPKIQTREELIDSCTIIIWMAFALHAAVNFGQYPYAGYLPNRPTISRRFMSKEGTFEYAELKSNSDKMRFILGKETPEWTSDETPFIAFEEFGKRLSGIEERIVAMNKDEQLKNRVGPVNMPCTLLYPTSEGGFTGKEFQTVS